ncbi:hypothetical protein CSUI_005574, partial [Cystoisospora suis]
RGRKNKKQEKIHSVSRSLSRIEMTLVSHPMNVCASWRSFIDREIHERSYK